MFTLEKPVAISKASKPWKVGVPQNLWQRYFTVSTVKKPHCFEVGDMVVLAQCKSRIYTVVRPFHAKVGAGLNEAYECWYELRLPSNRPAFWKESQLWSAQNFHNP